MKKIIVFFVAVFMTASLTAQTVTVDSVPATSNSANVYALFGGVTDTIFARAQWGDSTEVNEHWTVGYMIVPGTTSFIFPLNNLSPNTNYVCAVFIYYDVMIMSSIFTFTTDSCGLIVNVSSAVLNSCSEQLTATGGLGSYQWKRNGAIQAGETDSVLIADDDGSYTVLVSNASGCTGTSSAVDVDVTPIVVTACDDKSICAEGSTTLTVTGTTGAVFTWSTGQTGASISVSPTSTTNYTVTATLTGCTNTDAVQVKVNALPSISVTASATNICLGSLDPIYLYPSSADFTENGNSVNSIFTAIDSSAIGPHDIVGTITDNNGCQNSDVVTINVSAKLVVNYYDYHSGNGYLKLYGSFSHSIQLRINNDTNIYQTAFTNSKTEATFTGITLKDDDFVIVEFVGGGEGCSTGFIVSSIPVILFGYDNLKDKDTRIFDIHGNFIFDAKEKSDLNSVIQSLADGMYFQICSGKFMVVNGRITSN